MLQFKSSIKIAREKKLKTIPVLRPPPPPPPKKNRRCLTNYILVAFTEDDNKLT
jgi:hypothetical protein